MALVLSVIGFAAAWIDVSPKVASSQSAQAARVVINEVHYHPADDAREGEFVELFNHGDDRANVSGWSLGGGIQVVLPHGTSIPAHGYLVLARDRTALMARYGLASDLVIGNYSGSLSNGGERLSLVTEAGYLTSFVDYSDSAPWPESPDGLGPSLERLSPLFEDADPRSWAASLLVGGTPGIKNSSRPETEVESDPEADSGESDDAIIPRGAEWRFHRGRTEPPSEWNTRAFVDSSWELGPSGFGYGDDDDATQLDDMFQGYLSIFLRTRFVVSEPARVESLALDVDYDDGFIAYLNGVEIARANLSQSAYDRPADSDHEAGTPERFPISNPSARLVSGINVLAIQGHNSTISSSDFSLLPSLAGVLLPADIDGGPDDPPADEALTRPRRNLVINEVAPAAGDPAEVGTGWVELFNPTDAEVLAGDRRLSLFPATLGEYVLPTGTRIPAGGFAVIAESDLGFELDDIAALILTTDDGRFIDGFHPRSVPRGHASGRFPDGDASRFVLINPTRAAPNSLVADERIVINEVHYHPGDANPNTEFVELYNRSFDIIDLSNWSFTRGVSFDFADGTSLLPGRFLVVAQNPQAVIAAYGIPAGSVFGPYRGSLRNDAETILLRDALGNPADRVRFADEGSWPEETDGLGPSVELIHPSLENRYGAAWAASDGIGTPGAQNSKLENNPSPIAVGASHRPVTPTSDDPVRVIATLSDDAFIATATLFWEIDGEGQVFQIPMVDDGLDDDGIAGNRIYGAEIPPTADESIIAFWIRTRDSSGQEVVIPSGAPTPAFLYRVEDSAPEAPRPVYRLILRHDDLDELRTRGIGSNVLLDTTFVANGKAYYNRGIRLRGSSARLCDPLSYRVQFDHDSDFHGMKRLNLNGCRVHRQWIGYDFLTRTGLPTPLVWFRQLAFNGEAVDDLYLRVEAIDEQFLDRNLPNDNSGNLYRGVSRAYLDYRGEDADDYRDHYPKYSNEEADDYSDLFALCFGFDEETTPDEDFPAFVEGSLDVYEWTLFFAAFACLGSTENSILLDSGDDYFLYRRPSDAQWIALPWDLDSCFEESEQELFRPTVDSVERFLEHPRYATSYWCHLQWMVDNFFHPDVLSARLDHLTPLFSSSRINSLRRFVAERHVFITDRLQRDSRFEVISGAVSCEGTLELTQDILTLAGAAPACGTAEVRINDVPANFDPLLSTWNAEVDVATSSQIIIESVDRFGNVTHSTVVPFIDRSTPELLPTSISDVRTLRAANSPYRLSNNVTVLSNGRLIIEAGVDVLFDADATLRIQGRLVVQGTPEDPVTFRSDDCGELWEGIEFRPGSTGNSIENAVILGATSADGRSAAIWVSGADVQILDCRIDVPAVQAIRLENGASLVLSGSSITGAENGLGVTDSDAVLDHCRFTSLASRAIWARGRGMSPMSIDASIFETCGLGIELTDSAQATFRHLTLHRNNTGFALRQDPGDAAPGTAIADSLIISASPLPVFETSPGLLDISFSNSSSPLPADAGNLQENPLFEDADSGDYRLREDSPCRGSGKDGSDMGAIPYDAAPTTRSFVLCDSNADGTHDVSDVVYTLLSLFGGGGPAACHIAADCNSDRVVNVSDAVFDLAHLFRGEQAPRAPYPLCDEATAAICAIDTCAR